MTNRLGYCAGVVDKTGRHAASSRRGEFKLARAVDVPSMVALSWIGSKSVHFLSTGAATSSATVDRRARGGSVNAVIYPKIVADYHRMMGGVDQHDQLRLQSYSVQTSFRFKKYYKSLFVELIDLVIVNAYVTHAECAKRAGTDPLTRAAFMTELHAHIVSVQAADFVGTERVH